tara:strand:+ start:387 stop:554 length:168 start_codon:yes stop_codon:yes gene_type:complete
VTNLLELKNKLLEAKQAREELVKLMDERINFYENMIFFEQKALDEKNIKKKELDG